MSSISLWPDTPEQIPGTGKRPNVALVPSDAPNVAFGASDAPNATLGRLGLASRLRQAPRLRPAKIIEEACNQTA